MTAKYWKDKEVRRAEEIFRSNHYTVPWFDSFKIPVPVK